MTLVPIVYGDRRPTAGRHRGAPPSGVRRPSDSRFAEPRLSLPTGDADGRWARLNSDRKTQSSTRPANCCSMAKRSSSRRRKSSAALCLPATVDRTPVEIMIDLDGRIRRGKCVCGHFRQFGIRNGPCRHMIALRSLSAT